MNKKGVSPVKYLDIRLTFIRVVKEEKYKRSFIDQTTRVHWIMAEYSGNDGDIYRKAFETKSNESIPEVPKYGSHDELDKFRKQW